MLDKKYSYISNYFNNLIDNRDSIYTLSINFIYNHRFRRFYSYLIRAFDEKKEFGYSLDIKELLKISKIIFISLLFYKKIKKSKVTQIDTLIIDHLFNSDNDIQNSKIYGDLFSNLEKKNISFKRLLINHSNKIINNNLLIENIILNRTFNIKLLIKHLYNLILEFNYYKTKFKNEKSLINKKLLALLSKKIVSSENLNNIIIAELILRYIRLFKFKKILFTFEGNAWERILIYNIKKSKINCKIIGYNHTGIYKYHNSIRKTFNYHLSPDEILCVGKYSYNEFIKLNLIKKNNIKIIGYLNHIYTYFKKEKMNDRKKNIIFLPTAEDDECFDMLNLLCNFIKYNKNYKCIFRLHPLISKKSKIEIEKKIKSFKKNVSITTNTNLKEDLNKSFLAIYRDTSAIIYAGISRTLPVYFRNREYLDNNIISSDKNINISINNYKELDKLIIGINKNIIDKKITENIYQFCDNYYQIPNFNSLNK